MTVPSQSPSSAARPARGSAAGGTPTPTLLTVSQVTIIDLARVVARDAAETAKLARAMATDGYVFLDFRSAPATADIAQQVTAVYAASDDYFAQSRDAKTMDTRAGQPAWSDRGYKFCASDESFEMSSDELRDGRLELPSPLDKQAGALGEFQTTCHEATLAVVSRLADGLKLPELHERHEAARASESGLKLIAEPSITRACDVLENKHRDSGTLTLLFYEAWGIQVCVEGADEGAEESWVFVPPPPAGCALLHGAQSLARLSGGRLRSPLHRVAQPADGAAKRYFLSYFLRPERGLQESWEALDAGVAAA